MITKKIEKELRLLEKEDVIKAVSQMAGRDVELNELDVYLNVCMPYDSASEGDFSECWINCEFYLDDEEITDDFNPPLQDFFDECEFWLADDEIFAFDTEEFQSFNRRVDSSD